MLTADKVPAGKWKLNGWSQHTKKKNEERKEKEIRLRILKYIQQKNRLDEILKMILISLNVTRYISQVFSDKQ